MKRIASLAVLVLAAQCASAQTYGRLDFHLQNAQGQAVSGATVNVYLQPSAVTTSTVSTVQVVAVGTSSYPSQTLYYTLVTFTSNVPAVVPGQTYAFSGLTGFTALNGKTLGALTSSTTFTMTPVVPAVNQALFLFGSTAYASTSDTGTAQVVNTSTCGSAANMSIAGQAALYSTANGVSISQPVITNGFGEAFAYTAQGCYTVVYSSPYTGTLTYKDQNAIPAAAIVSSGGGGGTGAKGVQQAVQFNNAGALAGSAATIDSIGNLFTPATLNVGTFSGPAMTITPLGTPTNWTFNSDSPATAFASIVPGGTQTGSGASQVDTFPGTLAAGQAVAGSVNSVFYAAGYPTSGGTWMGAWASGITYAQCAAVSYSGAAYVSATGGNSNLTPGTVSNWIKINATGATMLPTQADCAFAAASYAVVATGYSQKLKIPPGLQNKCIPWELPNASAETLNLEGEFPDNQHTIQSALTQICAIPEPMIVHYPYAAAPQSTSGLIANLTLMNIFQAQGILEIDGEANEVLSHIIMRDEEAADYPTLRMGNYGLTGTTGYTYQAKIDHVQITSAPYGINGAVPAQIAVTVSGGVPSLTVTSGGIRYPVGSKLLLTGYRGSTADTPCSNMGTGTVTLDGSGTVTAVSTTATGCDANNVGAQIVPPTNQTDIVLFDDLSDSRINDLIIYGSATNGLHIGHHGGNIFNGLHIVGGNSFYQLHQIQDDWGGNVFNQYNCDTPNHDCLYKTYDSADFGPINNPDIFNDINMYPASGGWPQPGQTVFHFGPSSSGGLFVKTQICSSSNVTFSPIYTEYMASNGPEPITQFGPGGNSLSNIHYCDGSGTVDNFFSGNIVIPSIATASPAKPNQSSGPVQMLGEYNNGTSNITTSWTMQHFINSGADEMRFITDGSNPIATGLTSVLGIRAVDNRAATVSNNWPAPFIGSEGHYYDGAVSQPDTVGWQTIYGSGSNPSITYQMFHAGSFGTVSASIPFALTASTLNATDLPNTRANLHVPAVGAAKFSFIGTVGGAGTFDNYPALPQAITVDGVSLYVVTAPVGCSVFPVMNLWDVTAGGSLANVTLAAATNSYALTVTNAAGVSGHVLALRASTGPTGCSTNAQNITLNVLYH